MYLQAQATPTAPPLETGREIRRQADELQGAGKGEIAGMQDVGLGREDNIILRIGGEIRSECLLILQRLDVWERAPLLRLKAGAQAYVERGGAKLGRQIDNGSHHHVGLDQEPAENLSLIQDAHWSFQRVNTCCT